jgi:phosphatidylserine/phosphatidylglycerophosphate/cardiolipin synthase-like enzyme
VWHRARSTPGHATGAVVDGVVVAGSANWSGAGLGANLEAALAVDHPAAAGYYAAAFDRDWAASG